MTIRQWTSRALNLILPERCALCGREGALLCGACHNGLPHRISPEGVPNLRGLRGARAVWPLEGAVRQLVHQFKYSGLRSLAPVLGREMADVLTDWNPGAQVIVSIPSHRARLRERGYDQAALLADDVARRVGIPRVPALERTRSTRVQARTMDQHQRRDNVRGAFAVMLPDVVRHARVVLVDDVVTTGSTFVAASAALRDAGAEAVMGLAAAHEV